MIVGKPRERKAGCTIEATRRRPVFDPITCEAYAGCKEQSRSLRLGADRVLRPCLASRKWDIAFVHPDSLGQNLSEAALLSIDYTW